MLAMAVVVGDGGHDGYLKVGLLPAALDAPYQGYIIRCCLPRFCPRPYVSGIQSGRLTRPWSVPGRSYDWSHRGHVTREVGKCRQLNSSDGMMC